MADRCGFFSVLDSSPSGFVSWDSRRFPESVEIGHNCIRPDWKGRGFGTRQMREALRRISVARPRKIFVVTNAPLLPAQRMYERAGFRGCGREPAAGFPGDRIRYEYFPCR
nr:GNAT family N-acetyltransferase [uncultured Victivallis sp.]